ncbi:MAG: hypothetical protein IJN69_05475 [Oscillospiraceae bacterium]|nr:hypothetical protein [Oscillospiraceae bacterium]
MLKKTNDISKKLLITLAAVLTVARLFLAWTQYATIYPPLAPIDDHFMFTTAQNIVAGDWFGEYNYLTLSKHAFFAVWLAFLHIIGVPYMVGSAALWTAASVVLVLAVSPVIKKNWARLFLYAGLLYNPAVWAQFSTRIYRDNIFPSLCMLFFGCVLAVGIRYKQPVKSWIWWLIGYGITFGLVCLSREDGIWVLPFAIIAFIVLIVLWVTEKDKGLVKRIVALCLPFVLSAGVICSYCYMNYTHYGRFIVSDFTSSDFEKAYGALMSIEQENWHPLIAVPADVREKLYAEVPSFSFMEEALEEPILKNGYFRPELNDFQSGGFYWAVRTALQNEGYYETPQKAQQYYETLRAEIELAVAEGRLPAKKLGASVTSPVKPQYILPVIAEGLAGFKTAILFEQCDPLAEMAVGTPEEIAEVENFIRQKGGTVLVANTTTVYLPPLQRITHTFMRLMNLVYKIGIPLMFLMSLCWQIKQLLWDIRCKKLSCDGVLNIVLLGLAGMALLRCFMIAYVEVSSFNIGTYGMYLSTVYPLLILYSFAGTLKNFENW